MSDSKKLGDRFDNFETKIRNRRNLPGDKFRLRKRNSRKKNCMITTDTNTSKPATLHCSYDATYYSMYQPAYNMLFVFYDEEEYESSDWNDYSIPPLPDSGIQH